MIAFTLRRAGQASLTLVALAVATFFLLHLTPGGPAQVLLGPDRYTPEREAAINRQLGLSQPLPTQLVRWLVALVRGDLGYSYFMRRPAFEVVRERLPATLLLGGLAFVVALVGGVSWGVWAAARRGSRLDRLLSTIAVVTVSIPSFWLGIGLIVIFAAWLRLLPSAGVAAIGHEHDVGDRARHLILPLLTIAAAHTASLALYTRAALMETLGRDYIRTARSLGARERRVLWGHALRNAAIPVTTQAGLTLPHLIEGSVIVESVFAWPGIGQLTIASVGRRDYPILLVVTLLVGVIVVLATFLTDLIYHWLDPRVRYA